METLIANPERPVRFGPPFRRACTIVASVVALGTADFVFSQRVQQGVSRQTERDEDIRAIRRKVVELKRELRRFNGNSALECGYPAPEYHALVFQASFKNSSGISRIVLVFDPVVHIWPGSQPQRIVITDDKYREITAATFGGEPVFDSAHIEVGNNGNTRLAVRRVHRRPLCTRSTTKYVLLDSGIRAVEWDMTDDRCGPFVPVGD